MAVGLNFQGHIYITLNFCLSVVSSNKYVLATMQYIYAPGWNLYCIAVNLTSFSVSLSVNGAMVKKDFYIKELNSPSAYLLNNTLIVNNEMFSMVNIYDTDLATASAAAIDNKPGKYLSWDPDSWKQDIYEYYEYYYNGQVNNQVNKSGNTSI